jgi:hypothetical protein
MSEGERAASCTPVRPWESMSEVVRRRKESRARGDQAGTTSTKQTDKLVSKFESIKREGARTDVLHRIVEEDAAGTAARKAHDLTARDVRRKVRRKEGEYSRRDPEGVNVDWKEGVAERANEGEESEKRTHCASDKSVDLSTEDLARAHPVSHRMS